MELVLQYAHNATNLVTLGPTYATDSNWVTELLLTPEDSDVCLKGVRNSFK